MMGREPTEAEVDRRAAWHLRQLAPTGAPHEVLVWSEVARSRARAELRRELAGESEPIVSGPAAAVESEAHASPPTGTRSVPGAARREPEPTRADLERIRDELNRDGKPYGYGSIAKAANVSESTVRRRLGRMR
jgi:hypothetical protein